MENLVLSRGALFAGCVVIAACSQAVQVSPLQDAPSVNGISQLETSPRRSLKPATYTWSEWGWNPCCPGPPTNLRYFSGTVPTLMAPIDDPEQRQLGTLGVLLNNPDKTGDYGYWYTGWSEGSIEWVFSHEYFTGITRDAYTHSVWGISKRGEIFGPKGSKLFVHYFNPLTFTSLAIKNPAGLQPAYYLFATSMTMTYKGSGPPGSVVMLFQPSPSGWPNGTWYQMSFGAYQLSADPNGADIADLDANGNVWEMYPARNKTGKFIGWFVSPLNDVQCSNSQAISFLQVALKNYTFVGLDRVAHGIHEISKGVWDYNSQGKCWNQIGTKADFVGLGTDPDKKSSSLVWASDSHAKMWYAH